MKATLLIISALALVSVPLPAHADLARDVSNLLNAKCAKCHGSDEAAAKHSAPFGSLKFAKLKDDKYVLGGDAENSPVYLQVKEGDMPPGKALSKSEVALIKKWIDAGAPEVPEAQVVVAPPKKTPIAITKEEADPGKTDGAVSEAVLLDLNKQPVKDRPFLRYVSFAHLKDAGASDDQIKTHKQAFSKLINSLSWASDVVPPVDVRGDGTLLRIDLRKYNDGWSKETWETIAATNPYAMNCSSVMLQGAQAATGTLQPVIRGDWFIEATSRPPLYNQILKLHSNSKDLEKFLGIDQSKFKRAGFSHSGVSNNNRMIERYPTKYGAYWKSYDFAGNGGSQNIFANPFPAGSKGAGANHSFKHAGGEIIFNLPNGLQAYLLVKADGTTLDHAPTSIVRDQQRPDGAVENGISCMNCHFKGMISKDDEIRDATQIASASFTKAELSEIRASYIDHESFSKLMNQDRKRFLDALSEAGVEGTESDPIHAVTAEFEGELDLRKAAAELGVSEPTLREAIRKKRAVAGPLSALTAPRGIVKRDQFVADFAGLVNALDNGCEPLARCKDDSIGTSSGVAVCHVDGGPSNPLAGNDFKTIQASVNQTEEPRPTLGQWADGIETRIDNPSVGKYTRYISGRLTSSNHLVINQVDRNSEGSDSTVVDVDLSRIDPARISVKEASKGIGWYLEINAIPGTSPIYYSSGGLQQSRSGEVFTLPNEDAANEMANNLRQLVKAIKPATP